MIGQLEVIVGPDAGRSFALEAGQTLVIGRGRETATQLRDLQVSRVHCVLEVAGGRFHLTDSGSAAGTLVNGRPINSRDLVPGDVIRIGGTTIRLALADVHDRVKILPRAGGGDTVIESPALLPDHSPAAVTADLGVQTVSHYEILSLQARGQSGMVYKARDQRDGRTVAIKVLGPEYSHRAEGFQRFSRVVRTVVGLRHENLVAVYAGAGRTHSLCWIAMEYVEGESLREVIRRIGPANMLDWRYTLKVAVHIARALEVAHQRQIIHRNITPANILIRRVDNLAKLNDLILAKATEGMLTRPVTRPGELLGDLRFMPPERTLDEERLDARSDIYSLGATLYALLTGRPPIEGHSLTDTIARIRYVDPVKPKTYQPAISEPFQDIVLTMLAKRPEDRFQSATDLLRQLDQTAKYQGITI